MKDHPIAAALWLILVGGLIGLGAVKGTEASAHHREAEKTQVVAKERKSMSDELEKAIAPGKRGDVEEAITALEALAVKYPGEPAIRLNLGVAYRAAEKLDDADRSFAKVLELDPNDYDALAERATIQLERGDAEAAIAAVERIPANEGRMRERLMDDPFWVALMEDPRVKSLRIKHAAEKYDTSLNVERQKRKGAPQGVMIP
jgi:tetratricopeptide (TPR) repeat protein